MKPKTLAIALAALVLVVAGAVVAYGNNAFGGRNVTITVTCESGAPVEGIYVDSQNVDLLDSGWAENWRVVPGHPDVATATYWVSMGGPVEIRYGCGGSGANWDVSNDPGYTTAEKVTILCNDANLPKGAHNTDCKTTS